MTDYIIRPFAERDAEATSELFRDTVRRINSIDYSPAQVLAWAPDEIVLRRWRERFRGRLAYVARQDQQLLGFADLTPSGTLDRLFVSADHQRLGIGRSLVEMLIKESRRLGLHEIRTESSVTAKPFFLSLGFQVIREQQVQCGTEWLTNYQMSKTLNDTCRD